MATIDLANRLGTGYHASIINTKITFGYAEVTIDLAVAATTKGSALAAADVIEALDVPPQSTIFGAGVEVLTAVGGGGSAITLDVGVTGIDADAWVDGYDLFAAVAGGYSQFPAAYQPIQIGNTADTVDVLIATQTGTISSGVIRVFCYYADSVDIRRPGLALLKS